MSKFSMDQYLISIHAGFILYLRHLGTLQSYFMTNGERSSMPHSG